ncbi:MAG: ATP-binding protein [Spirochaetales bacterium]|nr:ATP-binding protein [Spirochaetales bacterium]
MRCLEFPSDYAKVRDFTKEIIASAPERFREGSLLEQQVSEIVKNAIKHGNRGDPSKNVKVRFDFRRRARLIVEDEGRGFEELDEWNAFLARRQEALFREDFDAFLHLAAWRGRNSGPDDGGNSLIAALEYWNGGMVFNAARNKVGVVRWFTGGSAIG